MRGTSSGFIGTLLLDLVGFFCILVLVFGTIALLWGMS